MEDTLFAIGSDLYLADLAYYQSVRQAAKRNRPGAEVIYNDLKARFPGGIHAAATPAPTPTPTP